MTFFLYPAMKLQLSLSTETEIALESDPVEAEAGVALAYRR